MRPFYIFILLTPLWIGISCAPRPLVHSYFAANRYMPDYYLHVFNDSLQMHFVSPADVDFYTDQVTIAGRTGQDEWSKKLAPLIYAKTDTPPYEVFVYTSSTPLDIESGDLFRLDTLLNGQYFYFIGNSLVPAAQHALESDMTTMFTSLKTGPGYNENIVPAKNLENRFLGSHKFLNALQVIQNFPDPGAENNSLKLQLALTYSSFLGPGRVYSEMKEQYENRFPLKESVLNAVRASEFKNESAIQQIVNDSENRRVIMINENHFYPEHRILVGKLLPALRSCGFSHLALEALAPGEDEVLNQPGTIPTLESGFYTREQQYYWLLKEAKALGFTFVAYEAEEGDREAGQARNLYTATFGKDAQARVIVLAGIDHILESSAPDQMPRMAGIFKTTYGIDPLTISQNRLAHYPTGNDSLVLLGASDFEDDYLRGVDYQMINHLKLKPRYAFSPQPYANGFETRIQVALFNGNEISDLDDIEGKIPYFTTILDLQETISLPLLANRTSYLVVYDEFGNDLEIKILSAD